MKPFLLENWVEEYAQKLYNRAFYLLNHRSDSEDMVQDVFLVAYEKWDQFKGNSTPLTWLMSILHNKIADRHRRMYKNGTKISLDSFFDEEEFWKKPDVLLKDWDFSEQSEEETFEQYLEHCLQALPQRWLLIVKLTYLEELKSERICRETEISKTNYWKILQRSRLQLRECIEKQLA